MLFDLTNAPTSFQTLINNILQEYLDDFALVYLDVLIFSKTYKEYIQYIYKVLQKLKEKDLPIKLSKYEFHKYSISFLGYIMSEKGLSPDPKKVQSIEEWPEPIIIKKVQALLGILNYYRKFIENFSQIAVPLTVLTKRDSRFIFGTDCREAFKELKRRLTTALILAIYDPEKEVILETDASDYAIGACLT